MVLLNVVRELHESINKLSLTLHETELLLGDRPYSHSLADRYNDAMLELDSMTKDILTSCEKILANRSVSDNIEAIANELMKTERAFNSINSKLLGEICSYEWVHDLVNLGSEHPQDWQGWIDTVRSKMDDIIYLVGDIQNRRSDCWQALVEHTIGFTLNLQTTSIQQISIPQGIDVGAKKLPTSSLKK